MSAPLQVQVLEDAEPKIQKYERKSRNTKEHYAVKFRSYIGVSKRIRNKENYDVMRQESYVRFLLLAVKWPIVPILVRSVALIWTSLEPVIEDI